MPGLFATGSATWSSGRLVLRGRDDERGGLRGRADAVAAERAAWSALPTGRKSAGRELCAKRRGMKNRIGAVVATVLLGCASVAYADECTNLAFAYAQAANSMTQKDLAALGQCVKEQMTKNKAAERAEAQERAKKPSPSGKKRRHFSIVK